MNKLDQMKTRALSNFDILKEFDNKVKVVTYDEISEYNNIDELIYPYDMTVILYGPHDEGHWTAIYKTISPNTGRPMISFFDSYGNMYPDDENDYLKRPTYPYLTKLLLSSAYPTEYNEHPFQEFKKNVNTCGVWVIYRLKMRHLSLKDFWQLFKPVDNIKSDDILMMSELIRKNKM